ncbi:MAG TPA: hypothetical protein VD963_00820 [Phycisphaerales bacterium]|nr:hypothetical protein [Phycisphaerales bacterium]
MTRARATARARPVRGTWAGAPGVLLLEMVLALALFVALGLAIVNLLGQASGSLAALRQAAYAADLARSALARIEAGIASPESLNGPVVPWEAEAGGSAESAHASGAGWELRIGTEPTEFPGLTLVTVTAVRSGRPGSAGGSLVRLSQLVRLGAREPEGLVGVGP